MKNKHSIVNKISELFLILKFSIPLLVFVLSAFLGGINSESTFILTIYGFLSFLAAICLYGFIFSGRFKIRLSFDSRLLIFFLIYYGVIIAYYTYSKSDLLINERISRNGIKQVFYYSLFFAIPSICMLSKNLKNYLVVKWLILSNLISFILLLFVLGISLGDNVDGYIADDVGVLSSLMVGFTASFTIIMSLYYFLETKKTVHGNIFFLIVLIVCFYILIICAKRGPFLACLLTILIFLGARLKIKNIVIFLCLFGIVIGVMYANIDSIILFMEIYNPIFAKQLSETINEGQISGREFLYAAAWEQFLENPLWGSDFIVNRGILKGTYSHNIFFDSLMTLGLVGTIPFLYFIYKSFIKSVLLIRSKSPYTWIALYFIFYFFQGQSTGSLFGNYYLWISMFILLSINTKINLKKNVYDRIYR